MPCRRHFGLLLSAAGLAVLPGAAQAAGPSKPEAARKAFDYRRPEPGEMLPNPSTGVGAPPQLKEYAPTATMGDATGPTPQGTPNPTPPSAQTAPSVSATSPRPQAAPMAQQAGPQPQAPAAAPASRPPSPSPDPRPGLQARFAAEIARSGIDGVASGLPAEIAVSDPEQRAVRESAWSALAGSLRASSTAWAARLPGRTPAALDRVDTVTAPGEVTIIAAPGRLTGAFESPLP